MALDIGSETHGDFRVLKLNGRLDTETSADFELAAHDLTSAGERRFVVDMGGISYVSSAGLRVLLALAKEVNSGSGGALRLCSLAPSVRQVFDLSGFSKLFTIAQDLDGALGEKSSGSTASQGDTNRAAASLLGASSSGSASRPAPSPDVGRQAAGLLGAKSTQKKGLFARLLGWLKGQ